eukprot:scaffold650752_cov43-Prasinocladus_malaysianus.AAC.1
MHMYGAPGYHRPLPEEYEDDEGEETEDDELQYGSVEYHAKPQGSRGGPLQDRDPMPVGRPSKVKEATGL